MFSEGGWVFLSVRDSVMGSCSDCIYSSEVHAGTCGCTQLYHTIQLLSHSISGNSYSARQPDRVLN